MNKLSKGVIAAAAATVLLLSTGGTLAYWNAQSQAGSGTITAGHLTLVSQTGAAWKIAHNGGAAANFLPATDRIVPGDVITYTGTYTIGAEGKNLTFEVGLADGAISGSPELLAAIEDNIDYTITTSNPAVTVAPDNTFTYGPVGAATSFDVTVTATITWDFDAGESTAADNLAQNAAVNLGNFTLSVTQVPNS